MKSQKTKKRPNPAAAGKLQPARPRAADRIIEAVTGLIVRALTPPPDPRTTAVRAHCLFCGLTVSSLTGALLDHCPSCRGMLKPGALPRDFRPQCWACDRITRVAPCEHCGNLDPIGTVQQRRMAAARRASTIEGEVLGPAEIGAPEGEA